MCSGRNHFRGYAICPSHTFLEYDTVNSCLRPVGIISRVFFLKNAALNNFTNNTAPNIFGNDAAQNVFHPQESGPQCRTPSALTSASSSRLGPAGKGTGEAVASRLSQAPAVHSQCIRFLSV